ncbi:MAG: lytic transglycosylase domain-containing protein [Bacteroidota bacterium]
MRKESIFIGVCILLSSIILCGFFIREDELDEKWLKLVENSNKTFAVPIPDTMSFCGEPVPLLRFDVRESLDYEMLKNVYWHSNTYLSLKRANRWFPIIEPILKKNNIPDDFKYLAIIESNFANVVSPVGASGYWQFMKNTGLEYDMEINDEVDDRYNVEKATEAACKYLNDAHSRLKNWTLVAASYNMGVAGLAKRIEQQGVFLYYDLYLNSETARYVYRILSTKLIMENPTKYGYYLRLKDRYPQIPTQKISVDSSINNLVKFAIDNKVNYKLLKYFNPWLRDTKLTNPKRKVYQIELPTPEFYNYYLFFTNNNSQQLMNGNEVLNIDTSNKKVQNLNLPVNTDTSIKN